MQTVSSLCDRLGKAPDWAVERLRFMLIEVDGPASKIDDDTCDLLIECSDDPEVAEKVRNRKLGDANKEKEKEEKRRAAAKKGAETRRAKAASARAEKIAAEAKTAEPAKDGPHPVAEIVRGDNANAGVVLPEVKLPPPPKKPVAKPVPAPKKKVADKPKGPEIVIGSAVDRTEPLVEIVRADGTHVKVDDAAVEEIPAGPVVEEEEEEEEISDVLAEAERVQEEEEERKIKHAAKPMAKPDPAVVAEVQRKAAELMAKRLALRQQEARRAGTGKTARKKQKRAERQRGSDTIQRDAAAAVSQYLAAGQFGVGPRKRKRKKFRADTGEYEIIEEMTESNVIEVEDTMSVEELANSMGVGVNDLILDLMDLNIMATKNQELGIDVIRKLAEPKGFDVQSVIPEETDLLIEEEDKPEDLQPRAPVITVMGHVDHGKTTFLDRVRSANVAGGEAGGITQHIAAYDVPIGNGRVVFLDTPGHEAFTSMRARGAQCTDIVVLVVAADDGVMPQTIEAIDHAKAADVPIVVAVNKIDKADAQPERIRQELIKYELMDEAWGGKTIIKDISAKQGAGVDELLELLVLQAEMLELKVNPNKPARGTIIESEISRGQGPVAWVLVQSGTLRVGDVFLAGETYGRARSIHTARGASVQEAGPSTPVVVTGFSAPPNAGDTFLAVADDRTARAIAEKRADYARRKQGANARRITLEDFHDQMLAGQKNILNVVLKADVQGSVDVFKTSLAKAGSSEVEVKIVHSGVGAINESDVMLASASDAVIIGFHVTASPKAQKLAEQHGVDVRTYRIIYEAIEEVRLALEGMLAPESKEVVIGHVEIRQVFRSSALGNIAGSYVLDGEISRTSLVRLTRDGVVVHVGKLGSLKRMKDDARTVATGFECGIKLDGFEDIKPGDIIEAYRVDAIKRTLE